MTEILPIASAQSPSAPVAKQLSARQAAEKLEATFLAEMLKSAGFGEQDIIARGRFQVGNGTVEHIGADLGTAATAAHGDGRANGQEGRHRAGRSILQIHDGEDQ